MSTRCFPLFALAISGLLFISAAFAEPSLTIGERELHPLSPDIFGQFLERPSWDGEYGPEAVCDEHGKLSPEIERHLAGMHAPVVRFPVGTDGDYIDWTDMINLAGRAQRPVTIGHENNRVTNRFGFDEYFDLAGRMGWRTVLVVNLRDALYKQKPLAVAAAHAAALVAYCGASFTNDSSGWAAKRAANGHIEPWSIAAVQVGNEGWFFWPPKPEERAALRLTNDFSCVQWLHECLVAYADAIKRVRPDLPLIADAPRPLDGGGLENNSASIWREAVDSDEVRSRYQLLAAHAYAPLGIWTTQRNGTNLPTGSLADDDIWNALVSTLGRFDANGQCIADAAAYDDIQKLGYKAAVTEWNWNGWDFAKKFPQASFKEGVPAALGTAGFLQGLMRYPNVPLANQSMMLGTTWGITSVRVRKGGSVGYLPQGEAVRLIAEHHGKSVVASELTGIARVKTPVRLTTWWPQVAQIAEVDGLVTVDDQTWYVHLINRQRCDSIKLTILLPVVAAQSGKATIYKLTGESSATTTRVGGMKHITEKIDWLNQSMKVTLPPASISVVAIPKG